MDLILIIMLSLLGAALFIAPTVFWVWMLIDCLKNEPSEGNDKIIWVLVIIFASIFGAVLYYFVRRPDRLEQYGR